MIISEWDNNIIYSNKSLETENLKFKNHKNLIGIFVKEITDCNHILYKQRGLYTNRYWKKFEVIGNYTGILTKNDSGRYLANLYRTDDDSELGIDAENIGNELRYINHYKNIQDEPNCKFVDSIIDGKNHILVIVTKDIPSYTEILIDYGKDYCNYYNI